MAMPFDKYRAFPQVELPDRSWPDRRIEQAPCIPQRVTAH